MSLKNIQKKFLKIVDKYLSGVHTINKTTGKEPKMTKATAKKLSTKGSTPVYEYRNHIIENVQGRSGYYLARWTYLIEGERRYTSSLDGAKFDIDLNLES